MSNLMIDTKPKLIILNIIWEYNCIVNYLYKLICMYFLIIACN